MEQNWEKNELNIKREGIAWVYNRVIDEYGNKMKPVGIAVYMILCRYADSNNDTCYPSNELINQKTGASIDSIIKYRQILEELRLVETLLLLEVVATL